MDLFLAFKSGMQHVLLALCKASYMAGHHMVTVLLGMPPERNQEQVTYLDAREQQQYMSGFKHS